MAADAVDAAHVWYQYLDAFDYFTFDTIRAGCHPRLLRHRSGAAKAIVLVHGLSDSPYFVSFIGDYFHTVLGYDVYMPLLHCHGLREPCGMEGVELEEWERNVGFAIDCAAEHAEFVAVGGLSTGGALSLAMANTMQQTINGGVYLFSAALALAGGISGLVGDLKELLLNSFLVDLFDRNKPLIGDNPYRYSHVDLDGAAELARLIKRMDTITRHHEKSGMPFPFAIFAAHSEADTTADIRGIERLAAIGSSVRFHFERFARMDGIRHASLVLKEPIAGIARPEPENPRFAQMMSAIEVFEGGLDMR